MLNVVGHRQGMKSRMLAIMGATVVALTGCSGGTDGRPTPSSNAGGAKDATGLVAAARCMRENGYPNFPDPVQQDGRWVFPLSGTDMPNPPAACQSLFDATKPGGERRNEVSGDDMVKLRQWADCIRKNGVADWPDPDSAGTFQVPARINPPDDDLIYKAAYRTCEKYLPSNGADLGNVVKPRRS